MAEDPFEGHRVLAFDLETTGLDTRRDRIVQYALVGSDEQGGSVTVDDIVNPQCKIPTNAQHMHKESCETNANAYKMSIKAYQMHINHYEHAINAYEIHRTCIEHHMKCIQTHIK